MSSRFRRCLSCLLIKSVLIRAAPNHNHFSQYFCGCCGGTSYCHPLAAPSLRSSMWAYLKKVYHQDNDASRFQLEHAIVMFQHGSLSIQDYCSAFLTLWHEYADLVTADVPIAAL
ncbi:hypothetical protein CK203_101524 [Vitis vinifera]|uniref:Retrotransposon gag domain-containing protein n=1 Tax=Vitis vinifera TaxID=29760 RepID=A0A438DVC3_VITVI|nr:hypothetical protein CK203_101524 [Vitis vinifera]